MKKYMLPFVAVIALVMGCKKDKTAEPEAIINENPSTFKEIASLNIGGTGAAEITAYDETSKKLFIVNNSGANRIEVVDIANPAAPRILGNINLAPYNGASNSVAAYNGKLAVALEALPNKQDPGKVIVFNTADYSELKQITVGALPDMITFSPDGRYILTANEGEPNDAYTSDPDGSVSIIEVNNNYVVTTLGFAAFAPQLTALKTGGFRIFGPANNLAGDVEPEYITLSADSKTAWVTLQENNGVAKIDMASKTITNIFPLGFKDYNTDDNAIDVSDQDGGISFAKWKLKGMYQPDAIAQFENNGTTYFITANEGDQREYAGMNEVKRMGNSAVVLDPAAFPNAATLKANTQMGRLNITTKLGDTDGDGDMDELYSFGARSFSIWNGGTGQLVFDSKNDLDKRAQALGVYDDTRSDDKGSEPEGVVTGRVGTQNILFVGLERADAFLIYDISNPLAPQFLQSLKTGDAPEGLLYIPAKNSPVKRSLLIVSSENDGNIKIYQPDLL
jgi:DNA-binding beta-propeller fold protein YncE